MRKALSLLLIFPFFFSGMPVRPQPAPCNCPADARIAVDTLQKIAHATQDRVVAVIEGKVNTADSLARVADSLAIEVRLLERDASARRVVGHVDIWREPGGKVNVWRWFFRKYPDGEMRFDTVIKRTYHHGTL